jgi:hypothetical protein
MPKPASLPLLPLPSKMATRPGNKDKHPGHIVRPKPRRTSEEVTRMKEAAAVKQTAEVEDRVKNLQALAQLEDWLRLEDAEHETTSVPLRSLKAHGKCKYMRSSSYLIASYHCQSRFWKRKQKCLCAKRSQQECQRCGYLKSFSTALRT